MSKIARGALRSAITSCRLLTDNPSQSNKMAVVAIISGSLDQLITPSLDRHPAIPLRTWVLIQRCYVTGMSNHGIVMPTGGINLILKDVTKCLNLT